MVRVHQVVVTIELTMADGNVITVKTPSLLEGWVELYEAPAVVAHGSKICVEAVVSRYREKLYSKLIDQDAVRQLRQRLETLPPEPSK